MKLLNNSLYLSLLILGMLCSLSSVAENRGNKSKKANTIINDSIYDVELVDMYPQFPGGNTELRKYILSTLSYPDQARSESIEGLVIVKMIVDEDGKINDSKVAYSADPIFEKEALRLVKKMPKWKPGQKDGQKVNVRVTLPIMFKL